MELEGKRVLVVGLARSGRAAAQRLRRRGAVVTVTDSGPPSAFGAEIQEMMAEKVGLDLGAHREQTFLNQDLIVVSPGVPWDLPQLVAARARKIPVVPEVELAGWFLKSLVIGVTGTNGKTTTTALLGNMLEASGFQTFVGGNIGVPLVSAVDEFGADSFAVVELSSFQLEGIRSFHPRVAVLLNLTPNHLDRHKTFEAYVGAKARIFHNQTPEDYAILNADDENVMALAPAIASHKIFFSRQRELPDGVFVSNGTIRYRVRNLERAVLETQEIRLRGAFNIENVLAATAAACVVGADFNALRLAVREFKGVEHRLEFVRKIRGVEFYNDSKATSVDATSKALSAFERGVHLILGGKDKGAPYTPLRSLVKARVREVLLIGAASSKIAAQLAGTADVVEAGNLETAVRHAFARAEPGDVVLLAPACASFDQFQDYEQRGRVFKALVEQLAREVEAPNLELRAPGVEAQRPRAESAAKAAQLDGSARKPERIGEVAAEQVKAAPEELNPPKMNSRIEPDAGGAKSPEDASAQPIHDLVYVYEVAAEEVGPSEPDLPPEAPANEFIPSAGDETLPTESAADEPMPFEIHSVRPARNGREWARAGTQPDAGPQRKQDGMEAERTKQDALRHPRKA